MKDRYLDFVNSPFGASVARSIGLPQPEVLRRHARGQEEFGGIAAIGAGPSPTLFEPLMLLVGAIGMTSVAHESALGWLPVAARHGAMSGRFEPRSPGAPPNDRVQALIFDATGIADSTQLHALYGFFHDAIRSVAKSGRIVVLGLPPRSCASPRAWTAQRALEGLTRSLGKEARGGISSNLRPGGTGRRYRRGVAFSALAALGLCIGTSRAYRCHAGLAARRLEPAARGQDARWSRARRGVLAQRSRKCWRIVARM